MDKYAVFGNPISHSKSPQIHQKFAEQTKQQMEYTRIEAPLDGFAGAIEQFRQQGGKGANVTVPFKVEAFQLADERSEVAEQAQAANTLVFREDGTIFADSTDGIGLIQDLTHNHDYSLLQKKILLIGAGGAACCVVGPLLKLAPNQIIIANRTEEKAEELAARYQLQGDIQGISLTEIPKEPFDLIINATSAGLTGEALDLPKEIIDEHTWCYDMVYSDKPTPFLRWAKTSGAAKCLDGLGMLVEQAAAAFYLWRGVYPKTQDIIAELMPERINS